MILRYLVVLPCFNNQNTIDAALCDVLDKTLFPVLVVDDGSHTPVLESLKSQQVLLALKSQRLSVVRHAKNLGKGAALKTAFSWALKNNKTHVISFDSDGQHLAQEITPLLKESRSFPWALVIGSRRFAMNVPGVSKFGRRFSNFWVRFETGHKALDSQSGFRIYPMFYVQNLSFVTQKYDFEIEILIRLLWKNVEVREVDIDVYYPPAHERVSHFHKLWDNVRISLLNCVLVVISLLRGNRDSGKSSLALGTGILIGCTPFFGLHIALAFVVAFIFRWNFAFLFLGTNISIPPLAPFLAIASISIGHRVLGGESLSLQLPESFEQMLALSKIFFTQWLVGSLILGSALGTAVGGSTYLLKKLFFLKKRRAWTGKTRGGVIGNGFLKLVLKYLGLRAGYFCLYFIIPYFYFFAPRSRRALNEYWQAVQPESAWLSRQKEIFKHFFVFGQVLMDRVYQSFNEELKFKISNEGPIYIQDVAASDRGWVFVGAHLGGWDISTLFLQRNSGSSRLGMVHFLGEGLTFDKVIKRSEDSTSKVDSIQSQLGEGSLLTVKSFLENKKHVGFLSDRAVGSQIELIPFLGKLAPFETRPYRVAVACRAPMVFTYNLKIGFDEYLFISSHHTELKYSAGTDRRDQVYQWTQNFAQDLEKQVLRFPHQWFNFYSFWSSLPVEWQVESSKSTDHSLLEELHTQEV